MSCTYFDQAVPGTGPPGLVVPSQSIDWAKYDGSFNLSLRSKSDLNLNPQPEGFVGAAYPKSETNREGVYALETDRGELSATAYTQVNISGQKTFQNRLQDELKPTMKETTLYAYDGTPHSAVSNPSLYSQYYPQRSLINGKEIRTGGSSNFGLKSALDYSYFSTPGPTSANGSVISNPNARIGINTKPVPDFNVDGSGTLYGAIPDAGRFQQYRVISKPTTSGLRFNYNLETQSDAPVSIKENFEGSPPKVKSEWNGNSVHNYSELLGHNVDGIENRYTASYQIAPLLTNPLNVIFNPTDKGTIPPFYGNAEPNDFAYMQLKKLPPDEWIPGGYNDTWQNDPEKTSTNSYILNIEPGVHNDRIEWRQGLNTVAGPIYNRQNMEGNLFPDKAYGGKYSVFEQYLRNDKLQGYDGMYTTLGDPNAGQIAR